MRRDRRSYNLAVDALITLSETDPDAYDQLVESRELRPQIVREVLQLTED